MESFIDSAGFAALILFGFLEAACIPISSEVTFGLAGAWAYHYHHSIVLVIVLGTLAELAGSYLSYYVGRIGGRVVQRTVGALFDLRDLRRTGRRRRDTDRAAVSRRLGVCQRNRHALSDRRRHQRHCSGHLHGRSGGPGDPR